MGNSSSKSQDTRVYPLGIPNYGSNGLNYPQNNWFPNADNRKGKGRADEHFYVPNPYTYPTNAGPQTYGQNCT